MISVTFCAKTKKLWKTQVAQHKYGSVDLFKALTSYYIVYIRTFIIIIIVNASAVQFPVFKGDTATL